MTNSPRFRRSMVAAGLAVLSATAAAADQPPISTHAFHDSLHHWRAIKDEGRFIQALPDQPSYEPGQMREIVANILLFQRADGGWPKDYDMTAVLTEEQRAAVVATHDREDASYDNGNLHAQIDYLAQALAREPHPEWRAACERGLDFVFASQYENGGFPQRWPNPKDFHACITFNDYVMIGCLELLRAAGGSEPYFQWLDEGRRAKAREAFRRGVNCVLHCQIRDAGGLTGWCQQHDQVTFEPRPGRTFELASICAEDTAKTTRLLMEIEHPSPEIRAAVEGAVAWMRKAQLQATRVQSVAAPKEEFQRYTADFDKVVVTDPTAPPLWARHYEIGTDRPVFAGRDGVKHYAFAEMERERRTGTPWYGTWPAEVIGPLYTAWKAREAGAE